MSKFSELDIIIRQHLGDRYYLTIPKCDQGHQANAIGFTPPNIFRLWCDECQEEFDKPATAPRPKEAT